MLRSQLGTAPTTGKYWRFAVVGEEAASSVSPCRKGGRSDRYRKAAPRREIALAHFDELEFLLQSPLLVMCLRLLSSFVFEKHHQLLDVITQNLHLMEVGQPPARQEGNAASLIKEPYPPPIFRPKGHHHSSGYIMARKVRSRKKCCHRTISQLDRRRLFRAFISPPYPPTTIYIYRSDCDFPRSEQRYFSASSPDRHSRPPSRRRCGCRAPT